VRSGPREYTDSHTSRSTGARVRRFGAVSFTTTRGGARKRKDRDPTRRGEVGEPSCRAKSSAFAGCARSGGRPESQESTIDSERPDEAGDGGSYVCPCEVRGAEAFARTGDRTAPDNTRGVIDPGCRGARIATARSASGAHVLTVVLTGDPLPRPGTSWGAWARPSAI